MAEEADGAVKEQRTHWRKRAYEIIGIGSPEDPMSRVYDLFNSLTIIANLTVSILYTFEPLRARYGPLFLSIEHLTAAFFALDYLLRLWTAKHRYPDLPSWRGMLKYTFSASGIIDVLSFLPYFLPIFFPAGAVAFRMFRVMRIFRLFRVSAYHDSLSVITQVITSKRQQLLSSVFIIVVLMLASSLCMYSLEHEAQPEVFANAFSGIWWSVSTLLTVGYGDIYPITPMGKAFSIVITFLGVGMVAIPTGIISAGFVDQYTRIKRLSDYASEEDAPFLRLRVLRRDGWAGKEIRELGLPAGLVVAAIQRGGEIVLPRGGERILPGDTLVLGAEDEGADQQRVHLKELTLLRQNPWNGRPVRELDISRQTVIVMVRRKNNVLIPDGDTVLREGDTLLLCTKVHIEGAGDLQI